MAALAAAAGCAARSPTPRTEASAPAGYHGVVVWPGGAEPLAVSFAAPWTAGPAAGERIFARADAGHGWRAHGRLAGDSLVWGLTRMAGDNGVAVEFAGAVEPGGRVRGCARVGRAARSFAGAAFALAPLHAPRPTITDAPAERCLRQAEATS